MYLAPLLIDQDGDGFEPPADCDDTDSHIHPDAVDLPYNAVDEDCDGHDQDDLDGDGWQAREAGGDDCADINPDIHPDATEICDDLQDNDCDDLVDEDCLTVADPLDPEGLAWICGASPECPSFLGLILVLGLICRRRQGRRLY